MNIAFCSTCMDPFTLKFNFDISEPKAKIMEAMEKLLDLQWSAISVFSFGSAKPSCHLWVSNFY